MGVIEKLGSALLNAKGLGDARDESQQPFLEFLD